MKISDKGLKNLIKAEGYREQAYHDTADHLTIGVGHKLTRMEIISGHIFIDGQAVSWWEGITRDQVEKLLRQDLERFEKAVEGYTKVSLHQYQFDALVMFAFNIGVGAFRKSTLLKELNAGRFAAVPGQLKLWVNSGGKKTPGLVNRRNHEIAIWNGNYANYANV